MKTQLELLVDHITENLGLCESDIEAWQESGKLMLDGTDKGKGVNIAKWRHTAAITLYKFPYQSVEPYNLLAMIAAYLPELDEDGERQLYELNDPDLEIDPDGHDSAMISIQLELLDNLEIVPDENGLIVYNGKRYRLDKVPVYFAENVEFEVTVE
ncbi:MAG: phage tail protein [Parashewanella sp.]